MSATATATASNRADEPTFREIAERLRMTESATRTAYHRALRKIAKRIALQAALLGYDTIEDYLDADDDRIARIHPEPDGTYTIRIYRPKN